jgi:hypothetical protein
MRPVLVRLLLLARPNPIANDLVVDILQILLDQLLLLVVSELRDGRLGLQRRARLLLLDRGRQSGQRHRRRLVRRGQIHTRSDARQAYGVRRRHKVKVLSIQCPFGRQAIVCPESYSLNSQIARVTRKVLAGFGGGGGGGGRFRFDLQRAARVDNLVIGRADAQTSRIGRHNLVREVLGADRVRPSDHLFGFGRLAQLVRLGGRAKVSYVRAGEGLSLVGHSCESVAASERFGRVRSARRHAFQPARAVVVLVQDELLAVVEGRAALRTLQVQGAGGHVELAFEDGAAGVRARLLNSGRVDRLTVCLDRLVGRMRSPASARTRTYF